ncbi:hypothetical protein ACIRL0_21765 [Streptomyces sp. NPDC102365]|uniref:hypothetical protein n=1 Tax=Streptomyces sp. NPDC102365 TaxID=3366162 RepID=UPI0037F69797
MKVRTDIASCAAMSRSWIGSCNRLLCAVAALMVLMMWRGVVPREMVLARPARS